ncbi:MAG: dephospho-CoA kinase [Actinobacteria bacterium]|nr:dephospho-CoA kinase [Actinomycetota bacterium]MSX13574.1 dephospho-CoA kinase [Actinomycetota bacterium]MSY98046.1 dephospho-CoA kinase [Actinomycetota bacterium]
MGLTGGIGSGKSTVASLLLEHGAIVIDADAIARELVEPGQPALAALVAEFGPGILTPVGTLSRGELAKLAFSDPEATKRLNSIMHPLIGAESARLIQAAPESAVVVYDMPLLVETNQRDLVDLVVVVDVPEQVQIERAVSLRGLEQEDVERRMRAQVSRDERLAIADYVIDNSGSAEELKASVAGLWADLKLR